MGYALLFARQLQQTSRKNNLQYETVKIQNQKTNITNQLAYLQQMADQIDPSSPDAQFVEMHRSMLVAISNSLDIRMAQIQTQMAEINAGEKGLNDSLASAISSSAPKYVG